MDGELIVLRRGRAGRITLNRPGALNALTHAMIRDMTRALNEWRDDPDIGWVIVDGAGERAFCAGADIRALHALGTGGRRDEAGAFFRDEYALNRLIRTYPKPYVALMDGVTMGGGVGISVHGARRAATERTLWAMPEAAIGLFPDVGMTYVLPRLKDHAGIWLGLTGARLDGAGACALGLATDFIPTERLKESIPVLVAEGPEALARFAVAAPPPLGLPPPAALAAFGAAEIAGVLAALEADGTDWARAQLAALRAASPMSLAITFEALRRGASMSFDDCLRMELGLARRCMAGNDFYEGVRAQVIDKDRAPKWDVSRIEDISRAEIAEIFNSTYESRDA